MRAPLSWLREWVDIPSAESPRDIAATLIRLGFEVEGVDHLGSGVTGSLVVGQVLEIEELTDFKKPIRYCQVDVGAVHGGVRGIVCGARNFAVGDLIIAALPGATLPGGFAISARETYGRVSEGMLCSERELGLSDDHGGILVLDSPALIGSDALDVLGLGDAVLDVSVNPDRGYAMSIRGLARELAQAFAVEFRDPVENLDELAEPAAQSAPREISVTTSACGLFVLRTLTNIDATKATPRWMAQRLAAAGMRPVSIVVDITNYVMLETGQPLHAFDADSVQGKVQVRHAHAGESLELIDHTTRNLDSADIVIADDRGVLSLAGIMGGALSEISDATTSVLLEAAHFDAQVIAASCRRHRSSTDASRRFERGVDNHLAPFAAHRAASLLCELAGATNAGLHATEVHPAPNEVSTTVSAINARLGTDVSAADVLSILTGLGCLVTSSADEIVATIPSWRPDITQPCDVAEEVGRITGYDSIPTLLAQPTEQAGLTMAARARRRRDNELAALGWTQVLLSPFMAHDCLDSFGCSADDPRLHPVRLVNPLSDEEPFMRTTVLPSLAAAVNRNRSRGADNVALFECSAVHFDIKDRTAAVVPETGVTPAATLIDDLMRSIPQERSVAAGLATGHLQPMNWTGAAQPWTWKDAIEAAVSVAVAYGAQVQPRASAHPGWHPGRCAELVLVHNGEQLTIGWAGELHPRVIEAWSLPSRSVAFEVYTDALEAWQETLMPAPFGITIPSASVVKEDVALVVPQQVTAAAVEQALRQGCGPLLESISIFDEYQGNQVPDGHKSLAFALRFRHPERSLRDDEVATLREAGIASAATLCSAVLRGR